MSAGHQFALFDEGAPSCAVAPSARASQPLNPQVQQSGVKKYRDPASGELVELPAVRRRYVATNKSSVKNRRGKDRNA